MGDRAQRRCTVIDRVAPGVAQRFVIGASGVCMTMEDRRRNDWERSQMAYLL
jgi:hypothetical protein